MGRGGSGGGLGLPKGWMGCPKLGEGLVGGQFLVFKTPLSPELNKKVEKKEDRFGLDDVFQEVTRLQKRHVLWIDLTNTTRYYRKEEVEQQEGFSYLKMAMEGHGRTPSKQERNVFVQAVDHFLRRTRDRGDYGLSESESDAGSAPSSSSIVAVHCTHGFNRTGFLICYYLMKRRGMNPYDAIIEFKTQRPPGTYRDVYVEELYKLWEKEMGGDVKSIAEMPQVETPSWVKGGGRTATNTMNRYNHGRTDAGYQHHNYQNYNSDPPSLQQWPPFPIVPPPLNGLPFPFLNFPPPPLDFPPPNFGYQDPYQVQQSHRNSRMQNPNHWNTSRTGRGGQEQYSSRNQNNNDNGWKGSGSGSRSQTRWDRDDGRSPYNRRDYDNQQESRSRSSYREDYDGGGGQQQPNDNSNRYRWQSKGHAETDNNWRIRNSSASSCRTEARDPKDPRARDPTAEPVAAGRY